MTDRATAIRAKLRRRYVETFPSKLADLEAARDDLLAESAGSEERARHMAHDLAGSGGAYGFPSLSVAAREVEHVDTPDLVGGIYRLIELIRRLEAAER